MATVAHAQVKVSVAMTDFEKDLKGIESSFNRTGAKLQTAGSNMTKALALPLVGLATAAVASGLKFEAAMNQISGVMRPTTAQMDQLRAMALKMGADTVFSATDAATAMLELGKAGFTVQDSLESVDEVMQLAAASGLSMAEAAEMSARTLNAFGLEVSDLAHVNDVLAGAVNATSLNIGDLQVAFNYVGGIARGFGISIEQAAAALGIMRDRGIQAETAGRSLREGLGRLANPVKAVTEVMKELNIDTFQQSNGALMNLSDIIGILHERGMTAAQSLKMFGDAAGPGMYQLSLQGSKGLDELTTRLYLMDGAAKEMADKMMQGLPGAFEQLKGSLETAGIAISKALEPALLPVIGLLTAMANTVATTLVPAFQALPPSVQIGALAFVGLVAAVGPATYALGAVMRAAAGVISTLRTAGIATFVGEMLAMGSATRTAAAAQQALAMSGILTSARTYTDVAAGMSAAGRAASASSIMIAGMSASGRAAAVSGGLLASSLGLVRTAFAVALGPVSLFVAAMYAVSQVAQSETFLHWASTSDGLAASVTRAAFGHQKLSEAQFQQAYAAMKAGEANQGVASGAMAVAERVQQLKQQFSGANVEVQALTQVMRDMETAMFSGSPTNGMAEIKAYESSMKQVGLEAMNLKAQGKELSPELQGLVDRFQALAKGGEAAGGGMSVAGEEAKAAAERVKDLRKELTGVADISSANEMVRALSGVDVSGLSDAKKVQIFETANTGIEAFTRRGERVPQMLQDIADKTRMAAAQAGKFGQQLDTKPLEDWQQAQADAYKTETTFTEALIAAEKAQYDRAMSLDVSALLDYQDAQVIAIDNEYEMALALDKVAKLEEDARLAGLDRLHALGDAFISLGDSIGGASGQITAGVGAMIGTFAELSKRTGGFSNMEKITALAQAAGATWSASRQGMLEGAIQGAQAGMGVGFMFGGPTGAAVGAAAGAGAGALMSVFGGGPTQEDIEATRELVRDFGDTLADQFRDTATFAQQMEAMGDAGRMSGILVRDAYREIGLSARDAYDDVFAMNDAIRTGDAAGAQRAIQNIQQNLQRHAQMLEDWKTGVSQFNTGLAQRVSGFADSMEDVTEATADSTAGFQRMEQYAVRAFAATFAQSKSVITALEAVKDPLADIVELQKKFGFASSEAFNRLSNISQIVDANKDLFASLEGINQMMEGLQQAALLTNADMALFGQDVASIFSQLQGRGVEATTAMALMQPTLQSLWEHAQKFGDFTDAGTQALIDQAEAAGIVGPEQREIMSQVLGVLVEMRDILASLPQLMAAATEAAADLPYVLGRTPTADATYTGGQAVARDGTTPTVVPRFANEGMVKRPTLAIIGDAPEPEMVLRRSTVAAIANGGGGGQRNLTVQVILQGGVNIGSSREFEDTVARAVPKGLEKSGDAWGHMETVVKQMVRS